MTPTFLFLESILELSDGHAGESFCVDKFCITASRIRSIRTCIIVIDRSSSASAIEESPGLRMTLSMKRWLQCVDDTYLDGQM